MSGPEVTTYVRYLYPGSFFPEEDSRVVAERDSQRIATEAPDGVFAFTFHDVVTMTVPVSGRDVELRSKALNASKRYYIDAVKLTAAAVEALPGDHSILLSNMRGNGWDTVLRCRTGNFQPLEPGDTVISTGATP